LFTSTIADRLRDLKSHSWQAQRHAVKNLLLFAVAYSLAYGYGSHFSQTASAPLWFPDSVLLCALLLVPRKRWWHYIAVGFAIRFVPGLRPSMPDWFVFATSANDVLKALLAAYLLRQFARAPAYLSTLQDFAAYLLIAVFLSPALSAFAGAGTRHMVGYEFWPAWRQWFLGDAVANLVLTPTLLYWSSRRFRAMRPDLWEILLWSIGFATSIYFAVSFARSGFSPIAFYLPVPLLIWAATRFGPIGASSALSLLVLLCMIGITEGNGPFSGNLASQNVLFAQLFFAVMSVPVLFVAISIEQWRNADKSLQEHQGTLKENFSRMRMLAERFLTAQEDERKKIALELHDDICQRLALVCVGLERFDRKPPGKIEQHSVLSDLRHQVEETIAALHQLSHQLHSSTLQHLGLAGGLRGLCRAVSQQHNILVNLHADEISNISNDLKLCLFRIAQEALSNAVKHAQASEIAVVLIQGADELCLEVKDNGAGFNPAEQIGGLGLVSMQERLRMVNGTFIITSTPGQGTVVHATVRTPQTVSLGAA
jgi:signal transduction histidine kinase